MKRGRYRAHYVVNPAVCGGRKPVELLTDRAKRYRANAPECRPKGRKRCSFCGSTKNPLVMHLDGDEANLAPGNLRWGCKSCNTKLGALFKKLGIGKRTRQFNPRGQRDYGPQNREAAKRILIDLSQRGTFGEMWAKTILGKGRTRSRHGLRSAKRVDLRQSRLFNPGKVPAFRQYAFAVAQHRRGSNDEWGKVIHATPPAKRREYAREIARIKKERGTHRRSEVPF